MKISSLRSANESNSKTCESDLVEMSREGASLGCTNSNISLADDYFDVRWGMGGNWELGIGKVRDA